MEESAFCRFYTIAQPLPSQATTTMENRLEKGIAVQAEIFGEGMRTAWQKSHINRWLAENCFGDIIPAQALILSSAK